MKTLYLNDIAGLDIMTLKNGLIEARYNVVVCRVTLPDLRLQVKL